MTITAYVGTPGSGKSYAAVRALNEHVQQGGVAAINFKLSPNWAIDAARLGNWRARNDDEYLEKRAKQLWRRVLYMGSSETAYKVSHLIRERKFAERFASAKYAKKKEGVGLLIIDEAQLYFNSRNWKENFGYLQFLTQHRKLRWDVILVTHSVEMIDCQIQKLIEYIRHFRNMAKVKFGPFHLPFTLFLSVCKLSGEGPGRGKKQGFSDWDRYNDKVAALYDSFDVFAQTALSGRVTRNGMPPFPRTKRENKEKSGKMIEVAYHEVIIPLLSCQAKC